MSKNALHEVRPSSPVESNTNSLNPEGHNEDATEEVARSKDNQNNEQPNVDGSEAGGGGVRIQINHEEEYQVEDRGGNVNERFGSVLEYRKDHPIRRFGRRWKRQEVQGVCCLALEVLCLVTLALISLHGLGYMGKEDAPLGYLPYSFSAKVLREFFTYEDTPASLSQCYFGYPSSPPTTDDGAVTGHRHRFFHSEGYYNLPEPVEENGEITVMEVNMFRNHRRCGLKKSRNTATDWLWRFFTINFLSVLTASTAAIFLLSLAVRRRKGLQVVLLLPSFLCFFISIFQQIPVTFHYNYVSFVLREDMRNALSYSTNGDGLYKSIPLLDQTQINMHCCGIDNPESWEYSGNFNGSYPGSCCNTKEFDCAGQSYIPKTEIWPEGCYKKEYDRIRKFERWSLLLLGLKIIAEVGLFCTLSDLTRFEVQRPEMVENSRCEWRGYEIKCRGIASIIGVTRDGRTVVKANCILPWRLAHTRIDLMNGLNFHLKRNNREKGSVDIIKRVNREDFRTENIQIDLQRKSRGIYIFILR